MLLLTWKGETGMGRSPEGSHDGATIPRSALHVFIPRLTLYAFSYVFGTSSQFAARIRSINEAPYYSSQKRLFVAGVCPKEDSKLQHGYARCLGQDELFPRDICNDSL